MSVNREDLFDRHLRGELNESETAELKRLLAGDGAAARAFIEHVNETNLIIRVGSQLQSAEAARNVVRLNAAPKSPARARRVWLRVTAAAACVIGLAVVAVTLSRPPVRPSGADGFLSGGSVQVVRAGVLLDDDVIFLQPGDLITASTNETAVIAYENEPTQIEVFPGALVRCGNSASGKEFELRRGGLRAHVSPQPAGKPMRITTAHAQATVVGTEFVVRADERTTKLDVFQGKVELAGRAVAKKVLVNGGYWTSATSSGVGDARPLCKCSKCRGTNEPSNCPNLKKKNEK